MRTLVGRIERVERGRRSSDWSVWLPLDEEHGDGRVRHVRTGEVADRGDVDRWPGRHIVVEYVDGAAPCA